jgi:hypothetical protein
MAGEAPSKLTRFLVEYLLVTGSFMKFLVDLGKGEVLSRQFYLDRMTATLNDHFARRRNISVDKEYDSIR